MKIKNLIGGLLIATMMVGAPANAYAASRIAEWDVSVYPGGMVSRDVSVYDATGGYYSAIVCETYSSSTNSPIVFSSNKYTSKVSIGGTGILYAHKQNVEMLNSYTVLYYCDGKGRTIAHGTVEG